MARKLNLAKKVVNFLQQNPEQKFTAREIADWIFKNYPDECRQKLERSTVLDNETALLQRMHGEINSLRQRLQKRHPEVKTTKDHPQKYYFTESTDSAKIEQAESGLNLPNTVVEFLRQRPEQKFTAREIADWIFKTYPDKCRQKLERSTVLNNETALLQRIPGEINSHRQRLQKRHPEVKTTKDHPRKYYFTVSADSAETGHAESSEVSLSSKVNGSVVKEDDLYRILPVFLWSELKIYSKRINEKRSRNSRGSGGNKWLHPDLVGMKALSGDWKREIKDCVQQYADKQTKLWSFEVKRQISHSNVRQVFFQAVSNSSWANFGYLVASEIKGTDTLKELRMLASLHGIGFILLNAETPSKSQIMIPAKERSEIDWDTANRLTQENEDFLDYIELISQFYQTGGKIRQSDWMRVEGD